MRHLTAVVLVLSVAGVAGVTRAEEKKADPTGSWKWTIQRSKGNVDVVLKLKLEGDKLTGTLVQGKREMPIEEGKYQEGEISFQLTREHKGQKTVQKFHGKLSDSSIKGTIVVERNGKAKSQDWEAKRATD